MFYMVKYLSRDIPHYSYLEGPIGVVNLKHKSLPFNIFLLYDIHNMDRSNCEERKNKVRVSKFITENIMQPIGPIDLFIENSFFEHKSSTLTYKTAKARSIFQTQQSYLNLTMSTLFNNLSHDESLLEGIRIHDIEIRNPSYMQKNSIISYIMILEDLITNNNNLMNFKNIYEIVEKILEHPDRKIYTEVKNQTDMFNLFYKDAAKILLKNLNKIDFPDIKKHLKESLESCRSVENESVEKMMEVLPKSSKSKKIVHFFDHYFNVLMHIKVHSKKKDKTKILDLWNRWDHSQFYLDIITQLMCFMDYYTLARIFRSYNKNKRHPYHGPAYNSIIYAGAAHCSFYNKTLQDLGFYIEYNSSFKNQRDCSDIDKTQQPWFS